MSRTEKENLALKHFHSTGIPNKATHEIGRAQAAKLLGLELIDENQEDYNAIRQTGPYRNIRIRTRRRTPETGSQRIGCGNTDQNFDSIVFVQLGEDFEVQEIWEAGKKDIVAKLDEPGSTARKERRSLIVYQFKNIAIKLWP
ncbi:MAG: hypothetical protein OXC02_11625 [Rhodobacteraceae bacterium]|nr:hypothetical protein [Paracoccaceae bacterium]